MDGIGSGFWLVAGFGVIGVGHAGPSTRELVRKELKL